MHHIGRIDHDRTNRHGWRVTIQRWNRISIRNFSDRHYGGRDQALAAAQVYRDELLAQRAPMTRRARCTILKKNNQSGVSGVTRLEPRAHGREQTLGPAYWVARWPGEGRRIRQRRFSVTKYGEWGAYLKAVQARQHGVATMEDEPAERLSTSA